MSSLNKCMTDYGTNGFILSHAYLSSNTFSPGKDLTLHFKLFNKNTTINAGFVHYTINVDGEEYVPQVDDLCSSISCPINIGQNDIILPFKMPEYIEPIKLYIEFTDYTGNSFVCFGIKVSTDFWSWLKGIFTFRKREPIIDVKRMLRGTPEEFIESTHNFTFGNYSASI